MRWAFFDQPFLAHLFSSLFAPSLYWAWEPLSSSPFGGPYFMKSPFPAATSVSCSPFIYWFLGIPEGLKEYGALFSEGPSSVWPSVRAGFKGIRRSLGFDRNTIRKYIHLDQAAGMWRGSLFPQEGELINRLREVRAPALLGVRTAKTEGPLIILRP